MWEDPIVKEIRKLREQYASKFKYNADAIFEDILKRQEKSGRRRLAFPARKPKSKEDVAQKPRQLGATPAGGGRGI